MVAGPFTYFVRRESARRGTRIVVPLGGVDHLLTEEQAEQLRAELTAALSCDGPWQPAIGDRIAPRNGTHIGGPGVVMRDQGGCWRWIVRWADGCEVAYTTHELRPASNSTDPTEPFTL